MPTAINTLARENKKSGCFYMRGQAALLERSADTSAVYSVVPAHEVAYEQESQDRFASWLGGIALEQAVHVESLDIPDQTNLSQLIAEAKAGDSQALAAVRMNTHTTVIETLLKTGNVTRIEAEVAENGGLRQHGHTYDSIFRNTMRVNQAKSVLLRRRAEAEALNWKRMETAIAHNDLDDCWFVVFSLPPESLSIAEMKREGFFVNTMTGVFQATTITEGKVITESGFVAGMEAVTEDVQSSEDVNNSRLAAAAAQRFDIGIIRDMYHQWGIAGAHAMSPEDLLATPLLIPKNYMPHGVSSIVELYDAYCGNGSFFGQRQKAQDYATFADVCAQKAAEYSNIADRVIQDLFEASTRLHGKPREAIQYLYDRVAYRTVEQALRDRSIDASVFGAKAEQHLEQARQAYEANDVLAFMEATAASHRDAVTSACGGGSGAEKNGDGTNSQTNADGGSSGGASETAGASATKGEEAIKWRSGYCRLDASVCPEKGKKTLVGQCEVCIKCQTIYFDKGVDPTKFYVSKRKNQGLFALVA